MLYSHLLYAHNVNLNPCWSLYPDGTSECSKPPQFQQASVLNFTIPCTCNEQLQAFIHSRHTQGMQGQGELQGGRMTSTGSQKNETQKRHIQKISYALTEHTVQEQECLYYIQRCASCF